MRSYLPDTKLYKETERERERGRERERSIHVHVHTDVDCSLYNKDTFIIRTPL